MYPGLYPFYLTAFRTGMRLGELLAMEWGDIDFDSKYIDVRRALKNGKLGATATESGMRRIDMSDQLIEELMRHRNEQKKKAVVDGKGDDVGNLIFNHYGSFYDPKYVRRRYKRILAHAGIRELKLRDTRHSFANILLTTGHSIYYVKEQLGHKSIKTTVDIYGHLIPNKNREVINSLDDATKNNYIATKMAK